MDLTLPKTDRCDADVAPASGYNTIQTNGVRCGSDTEKCGTCNLDSGFCAEHQFECRFCTFKGCEDCVEEHEAVCLKNPKVELCDVCEERPATCDGVELVNSEMGFKQYGNIKLCDKCADGRNPQEIRAERHLQEWKDGERAINGRYRGECA